MGRYVLDLQTIERTDLAVVGGKALHLAVLSRFGGVSVPPGFAVTTAAFRACVAGARVLEDQLDRLSRLSAADRDAIAAHSSEIRATIEATTVPDEVAEEITRALVRFGERVAYAVRSSATAEDSPITSFAGQHDTYLGVVGAPAILEHVRRCWASLFTERAVAYRARSGLDHRKVQMAVVVERMVSPRVSGVMFTADPVSSNRKVAVVEACFGLGDALVSGRVHADVWRVRDAVIVERLIRQDRPTLSDAEVLELVALGRRIEAQLGAPQDVEWCVDDAGLHVVQSRPITTLFPIPDAGDLAPHVYVSVGHQQMMTDAMKPLGLSLFQHTALRPMFEAGGRLFVDVTRQLASPASRASVLDALGRSDPLIRDALETIIERGFVPELPDAPPVAPASLAAPAPIEADPTIVPALIAEREASLDVLKREIQTKSGPALFDFILADLDTLKRQHPRSIQVIMAAIEATWWLDERLEAWLGEENAADTLAQSVPHNVSSEMGLALLDVADAIRPHPEVVRFLEHTGDERFLDALPKLTGGREARDAILAYLERYGMRCVGEIDVTRPRWRERPLTLVPLILGNVRTFELGERARRFDRGLAAAKEKELSLLERLRGLPDGENKAEEAKRMIDRLRTFIGFREYPKYSMVSRYFVYKQALLAQAERLVSAGVIREEGDIDYLTLDELRELVTTHQPKSELVRARRESYASHRALTPPRVLTSEGEIFTGAYRRDVPSGALIGLPVSAGTIEGRARVLFDLGNAALEPGDILVTTHTDPSWTPLFVAIAGLVTEVGGLMTHGAVIAREYGLPAVVGVEDATRLIRDGQRIRVHGSAGYVELLERATGR